MRELMDKSEVDAYLGFLLDKLSEFYPQVSKELTKRVNGTPGLSKYDRKTKKFLLLFEEKKGVLEQLFLHLNKEFGTNQNSQGYSSGGLFNSIYYLVKSEPIAGSFGTKYDFGQGPVDE